VAQPLPALAHGNLFRPENGQDRLCGVLGIHVSREKTAAAFFELDGGDGKLRKTKAEESIILLQKLIA
jgi:hypothetical protein